MLASALFWVFAILLIVSAALVISARNPVHAVLFLILGFFNAAGLFLLAGAEFLAMILVVVYVGAVAVLFLFVVMMLDVSFTQVREGLQRYAPVGTAIGIVLLVELVMTLGGLGAAMPQAAAGLTATPTHLSNTTALGLLLYTHYVLAFQLSGLVLLVAMIGAIVLTLREKPRARRQSVARQPSREVADTLQLVNVRPGQSIAELGVLRPLETPPIPSIPDLIGATASALPADPTRDGSA